MKITLLPIFLLALAACSKPKETRHPETPKPAPAPLEAIKPDSVETTENLFQDPVRHYHLIYPKDWTRQPTPNAVVFKSPKDGPKDEFQENVSLMLQDISKEQLTLDEFIQVSMMQVQHTKEATILSVIDTLVHGVPAKIILTDLENKGSPLKLKQLCIMRGTIVYILTYTAEPKSYRKFEPAASRLMGSIEFEM